MNKYKIILNKRFMKGFSSPTGTFNGIYEYLSIIALKFDSTLIMALNMWNLIVNFSLVV